MGIHGQQHSGEFCGLLKYWRQNRKLSQLDLALTADVSQRHLSWLETGRSQPSREMVLRLAEAMNVPLRERNQILHAAGFAGVFTEKQLDEPSMKPVLHVLSHMLDNHEPYPAIVLDRQWNIRMKNKAANILFEVSGDPDALWESVGDQGDHNLALLCLHPNGLRQFISNWQNIAGPLLRRLQREATESGDQLLLEKYRELEDIAGDEFTSAETNEPLTPILPLEFALGELTLSLFSVISTFGTPQDITTDELRIETFYPTDEATAKFFKE